MMLRVFQSTSIDPVRSYALESDIFYWIVIALCGVLVVLAATLSYLFIERPGIRLGKTIAGRVVYSSPTPAA